MPRSAHLHRLAASAVALALAGTSLAGCDVAQQPVSAPVRTAPAPIEGDVPATLSTATFGLG